MLVRRLVLFHGKVECNEIGIEIEIDIEIESHRSHTMKTFQDRQTSFAARSLAKMTVGLVAGVTMMAMAGMAGADTRIERNGKVYVVVENGSAGVCKAIVRDQPSQLRHALYHGIAGVERTRAHTKYACNDMNLLSFAREVQASNVIAFLQPKFERRQTITTEEVATR